MKTENSFTKKEFEEIVFELASPSVHFAKEIKNEKYAEEQRDKLWSYIQKFGDYRAREAVEKFMNDIDEEKSGRMKSPFSNSNLHHVGTVKLSSLDSEEEEEKHCIRCGLTEKEVRRDSSGCSVWDNAYKTHKYSKEK